MKRDHEINDESNEQLLTTAQLAEKLGLKAQTLRKRYSETGSYFSVVPVKLVNRTLRWPSNSLEKLVTSGR
jgi:predicted DNA-binding transcriptional regulator AlpA